ncbi:MAG: hypothetical protein J6X44_01125, partial [Thermoguttaceae bacterium]|nr:hypothetical protein [Thermoguttaceae bacterium]
MNKIKLAVAGAVVAVFCGYTQPGWAQTQISLGRAKPLNETPAASGGYLFYAPPQYEERAFSSDAARFAASSDAFKSSAYQSVPKAEPMKPLPNAYHAQMCRFEEPVDAPALPNDLSAVAPEDVDDLVDLNDEVVLELDEQVVQPTPAPAASNPAPVAPLNEASGAVSAAPVVSPEPSNGGPVVYQPTSTPAETNAKKLP